MEQGPALELRRSDFAELGLERQKLRSDRGKVGGFWLLGVAIREKVV